mmetsp:Transcript_69638/g.110414  ORF Transcript_69638/g.110414 Transcript_69638/m.110414 type:complete len:101 (-) Transcript_69638:267-569(-)
MVRILAQLAAPEVPLHSTVVPLDKGVGLLHATGSHVNKRQLIVIWKESLASSGNIQDEGSCKIKACLKAVQPWLVQLTLPIRMVTKVQRSKEMILMNASP